MARPGLSAIFANTNRNKRSVALDLKSDAGGAALMKLMPTADAFVHNMRQEAMDKFGFTFNAVRAINPSIIYAAAIGYGRHGRYAGKPAYDDVIQAASGFAGLFQMRDGTPLYAPTIVADKVSGLHLAYAVMAALLYRDKQVLESGFEHPLNTRSAAGGGKCPRPRRSYQSAVHVPLQVVTIPVPGDTAVHMIARRYPFISGRQSCG